MQFSVLQDIIIVFKLILAIQMLASLFWQNDDFSAKKHSEKQEM
jgi:hypothetical protein